MSSTFLPGCALCANAAEALWRDETWRVIRVVDADFPAFYRVIHIGHVSEFSELSAEQRARCIDLVTRIETVLRRELAPTKINLASLGNLVPHLHWHVVARFDWDSHFPQPIWASSQRMSDVSRLAALQATMSAVDAAVLAALA